MPDTIMDIGEAYSLGDVINDNGAVCISIIHGRKRLVALLSSCVPNLKFYRRILIECDGLCKESGTDG